MQKSVLLLAAAEASAALATYIAPANCTAQGEALCSADGNCASFGIYDGSIQLHGCTATVPNPDWTIYIRNGSSYARLPGTINVNETACPSHPNSGMEHPCEQPPPPSQLYQRLGSIDVFTFENTIFYWNGRLLNLENIPCSYWDHAGQWVPAFGNHSYARIRDFLTGDVLVNITNTASYGFITPLPDYTTGTLWLFGTPADRCSGNGSPKSVQSWWTTDPALQKWGTALAFDYGAETHNVQVTRVGPLGGASPADAAAWEQRQAHSAYALQLPPLRYAMMLECFAFAINNNADGNLTYGWTLLNNTRAPPGAPCGGPAMHYNPSDGHFYILTGGTEVYLYRTLDFQTWEGSRPAPFIQPSAEDAAVAPFSGFLLASTNKGSPPNAAVGVPEPYARRPFSPYWEGKNASAWVRNSNDADVCCLHADVNTTYVIWGASTQGRAPSAPLTGSDAGTNAVGVAPQPLVSFLGAYFNATGG